MERDIIAHFPSHVSQAMVDYVRDVALKWSRYIFTRRQGKQQYGYCTHCKKEYKTYGLMHNDGAKCPECNSECIVKASGRGRKKMVDEVYFVYYEKSVINPKVIVARGVYALRDYRFDYRAVDTQFINIALYVFEPGNSRMLKRWAYYASQYGECTVGKWEKPKSVHSLYNNGRIANVESTYSRESIETAVKGTPFNWCGWESYNYGDMVKFFDMAAKYPCIEYLTKLGMGELVRARLTGDNTYSAINWRGKSLESVLRLSKKDIKAVKKANISPDPLFLKLLQIAKKDGSKLSFEEILSISYSNYHFSDLQRILKYTTLARAAGYLKKQHQKSGEKNYWKSQVLITWRDYIDDCIKLGMDLSQERVLFPKDLLKAHQRTIKQVKVKADELLKEKIKARSKSLEKYCFEYKGLLLRPARSAQELIDEGKALCHCVGNYAKRYAKGETNILFVRKSSEPDKPYFTVEIRQGDIAQVRGKDNCSPSDDIERFIDEFKEQKLGRDKKRSRVAVPT